jgi:hypothetical protein
MMLRCPLQENGSKTEEKEKGISLRIVPFSKGGLKGPFLSFDV